MSDTTAGGIVWWCILTRLDHLFVGGLQKSIIMLTVLKSEDWAPGKPTDMQQIGPEVRLGEVGLQGLWDDCVDIDIKLKCTNSVLAYG